jgi:hypothetical protein
VHRPQEEKEKWEINMMKDGPVAGSKTLSKIKNSKPAG